jgi:transcriptional regulator with XRE-family HTH domain
MKTKLLAFKNGLDAFRHRKAINLNQSEFWRLVGVTQSGGSRYESGRNIPIQVLILLTMVYGTPEQYEKLTNSLVDGSFF